MHEQRPLTEHEKAVVQAIVAALKPLLAEIERRLDVLDQKLNAIMAHQQQARPRPALQPPRPPMPRIPPLTL